MKKPEFSILIYRKMGNPGFFIQKPQKQQNAGAEVSKIKD